MRVDTLKYPYDPNATLRNTILIGAIMLVLILMSNALKAQTRIGIRGGVNVSEPHLNTTLGSTAGLTKSFVGVDLGLIAEVPLSSRLEAQMDLGYAERGIRLGAGTNINVLGGLPIGIQTITKIRLLQSSVLGKYAIGNGPIKGYMFAGPTLSYAVNGNFKTRGNLFTELNLVNQNISLGAQNRFALGATGGLGIEIAQGKGSVFMDVRYIYQSLNINNLPVADLNIRNRGVGFNLGYKISI